MKKTKSSKNLRRERENLELEKIRRAANFIYKQKSPQKTFAKTTKEALKNMEEKQAQFQPGEKPKSELLRKVTIEFSVYKDDDGLGGDMGLTLEHSPAIMKPEAGADNEAVAELIKRLSIEERICIDVAQSVITAIELLLSRKPQGNEYGSSRNGLVENDTTGGSNLTRDHSPTGDETCPQAPQG